MKEQVKQKSKSLVDRAVKSWKSSAIGVAFGAVVYAVLENAGCDINQFNPEVMAAVAIPVVMGLFGFDRSQAKNEK